MKRKYLKSSKQRAGKSTMESGDHFKNGTSPKSRTGRRRFNFFAFLSIAVFLLCACSKEKEPQPFIDLDITAMEFESEGGSRTVQVLSNGEWSISGDNNWCEVSPKTGKGNASVTVSVSKNDSFEDRETDLSFTCGQANAKLEVSQWSLEKGSYNYLDMEWDKNTIAAYDENTGTVSMQYQGALPAVGKNRAIILPEEYGYDIRVISDYSVSGNTLNIQTVQGTMSNIFMNVSFTLSTDPSLSSVQTKSGRRNRVITPSKIEAATENGYVTIYDKSISTKAGYEVSSGNIFSFKQDYSGSNLYSDNGHRVFWEKCAFDIGMKGVFFFDFGQTIVDRIPWGDIETFEFYLDGHLNIDLLLKYVFEAQFKKGDDVLVRTDAIPMMKFQFIVGGVPVMIFVFTNLHKKYDMEANAEISMSAGFNIQANAKVGLRYTKNGGVSPISSFSPPSVTPHAPTFTAKGSLAAKGSMYPRVEFQIYKFLCPWVDFMPYLSESFEGGMRASMDGNNYLAWTSKTNAGIDCRMGFNLEASIFLPLIELWKSNIYNLVDKNLFDMPKKIELVSPENGKKMNTGESVDVSFFVTSLNNITGNYFPCTGGLVNFVTNGETDKTVAISDLNGRVTVKWKPTAKGNVLAAKIVDKDGETISEATFTPVVEEKDYTVNVIVENSEYCSGKVDIVSISSGFIENENGMLLASVSYNSDRFSFDLPTNVSDQYLVGMGEIAPGMTVSDPRVKVLPIYLYAYKLDPETKQLMITGEFYHGYYRDKSNFCKGNLIYADRNVRVTGSIINESKYHTTKFSLNLQKGWNIMYGTRTLKEDGWEEDEISAQAPAIARWYFDRDYLRNGLIYYD